MKTLCKTETDTIGAMHNGYYLEKEKIEEEIGEKIDFGFMENLDFFEKEEFANFDMFQYLHGFCDQFAIFLNQLFGYKIYAVFSPEQEDKLVHAYCSTISNGRTVYIDARGITTDIEEFWEEFEDEFDYTSDEVDLRIFDSWEDMKISFTAKELKGFQDDSVFLDVYGY